MTRTEEHRQFLHQRALWLEWLTVSWNVIEAVVAIGAGLVADSTALIGFGVDSLIEVTSAVGLLWRLYRAGASASAEEHSEAERKALYAVAITFSLRSLVILSTRVSRRCSIGRCLRPP